VCLRSNLYGYIIFIVLFREFRYTEIIVHLGGACWIAKGLDRKLSHVFISYNRKADGDFADLLVSKLQSEGFSTWVDNDMLIAGEDWRATIDKEKK
jgi:TIR domain